MPLQSSRSGKSRAKARRPRIYKDGWLWRVQVGKWNNTFGTFNEAQSWAVKHYAKSNKDNWQAARMGKVPFVVKVFSNPDGLGGRDLTHWIQEQRMLSIDVETSPLRHYGC